MKITPEFIAALIAIARDAGDAILTVYNAPETANVQLKADDSPLTAADLAAHRVIADALPRLLPIPMISEEASLPDYSERKNWDAFWLIDPLDGTKEFIARNGQFTVNIALVIAGKPLAGVVHLPVTDETYIGVDESLTVDRQTRAEKYIAGKKISNLACRSLSLRFTEQLPFAVLESHRHGKEAVAELLAKVQSHWPAPLTSVSAGSSLKFCLIAEGKADFYPRLAPTCEWDTAAAQAVLCAAGGTVVNADNFVPLICNSNESFLNPSFLALGDVNFNWRLLLT